MKKVAAFLVDGANFDGTNDYMLRGAALTGAADSYTGAFFTNFKLGGITTFRYLWFADASTSQCLFNNANKIRITLYDITAAKALIYTSTSTYTDTASWHSLKVSWNTNAGAGAKTISVFIDDVQDTGSVSDVDTAFQVGWTGTNFGIGAALDGSSKQNADLAQFWLTHSGSVDMTNSATRALFTSTAIKPVNLGADGSTPTGTAPIIYFHLDDGEAAANFATNRGSGGNFTITGTLTTSATSPSD